MKISKRVLLVTSAAPSQTPFSTWEKKPPLGVGFLLSMLRQAGHDVFFIDNYLEPSDFLETGYLQANGIDYVGIYVSTICFRDTQRMLHKIDHLRRSGQWHGKLIVGGPHTTVALATIPDFVDHVVQGEGEQAIVDIVEDRVRDRVVRYPRIRDLDALPMPAWDLFAQLPYSWEVMWFPETPTFTMTTSRGCPFRCAFCSVGAVWGKQYTSFSATRIVSDIEHLVERYGARGIYFREDNFTLDRKRVVEFCKLLMERHIDIRWACESRVDSLDRELLELMHEAGARGFYFGVESGSQRILNELQKGITVDQIRTSFRLCNEIGFTTAASIVVGLPQETDEDLAATDALLSEIRPTVTWHNVFVGIPNSKLYRHVVDRKQYEFIDDRGLVYLKGHNDRALKYYRNAWDAAVPFQPESPTVSVIMAAHNASAFLEKAVHSILKQTCPNFELLVVDDASTDETAEILGRFDDPRVRIITNHEKLGPAGARNKALAAARGLYIAIMDADDISLPHRLETQIRFLESHPDHALVGSSYYEIDAADEVRRIVEVLTDSDAIRDELLHQNWFGHSTVMMRKSAAQALRGYDERYYYSHDYDLFLRMAENFKLSNIGEPLCCWRSTPGAISGDKREEQRHYAELAVSAARERRGKIVAVQDTPLVSVIVPTYNRPDMLGETLQSVLQQTYSNVEIVVVNDAGSCVKDVIASLGGTKKIHYMRHEKNRGLSAARNTGIRAARGKYIAYLDDDDVYYPDHIDTLVTFLESSEYSVAYTDAYRAHQTHAHGTFSISHRDLPYSFDFDRERMLEENFIPVLCVMHRKGILNRIGLFDEKLKRTEDWDLWIRMSRHYPFAHIKKTTGEFRWRADGSSMMTASREPFAWAALQMFHKYRDFAAGNHKIVSHHYRIVEGSLRVLFQSVQNDLHRGITDTYRHFCGGEFIDIMADMERFLSRYPEHRPQIRTLMELLNIQHARGIEKAQRKDRHEPDNPEVKRNRDAKAKESRPRAIAFYLPQFHPIPENDAWWGKGFTEWTNVAKAKPLFPGHEQPHHPGELGFYDLRLPESRKAQAELAKAYGIEGFCYYHYWFNGKLLLERPLQEVLKSGEPDFPFCLCWANENWTRTWDGSEDHILMEQQYSEQDDRAHIRHLCEMFRDRRYIRVNGMPLFLVYRANRFPDPLKTTAVWREEARRLGIGELYLCRVESFPDEHTDPRTLGFDAAVEFQPDWTELSEDLRDERLPGLTAFRYERVVDRMLRKDAPPYRRFPCVTPSWDNTPRRGKGGLMLTGASPAQYGRWLRSALKQLEDRGERDPVVFINAWNEWGEGNHLEPDAKFGRAYLEATKSALDEALRGERGRAAEAHEGILKLLVAAGKRAEAVFALEQLLGSFPDYAPAYNDLGVLYGESGDFPKALAAYEKAVSLDPANQTFRKNLGDFHYVAMKQPQEAVLQYEQALRLNPQDTETLLILGNLRVESGRFREARELYLRALELDPSNELAGRMFDALDAGREATVEADPETLYREARSLVQRGRTDQAIGTLEKLLETSPGHSLAHNDMGFLLFGRGEAEKARFHYEKAVAADPHNVTALKNLADIYFVEAGRLEDALQLYHRILQEQPRDVEALRAIGAICVQLGRHTDAAEIFRLIRVIDPADAASARILENLGALPDSVPPASPPRHQPGDGLICHYPFHFMQIFYDKVYFCCPDWTKFSIGNLREQSLAEIWNSPTARLIRQKMYRDEWEDICNPCCPYIAAHRASGKRIPYAALEDYRVLTPGHIRQIRSKHDFMEHPPTGFKIDNSNTCNLDCLMCTRHANADDPELIRRTEAEIAPFLPSAKVIYLTGNGEPLAIRHTREMISGDYSFNPDLEFNLITNGLLLPKFWSRIQHQKFGDLMISIDAATKSTYEKIRRGGTWESLMKSLALVKSNRDRFRSVTINMTVMRENYREIPAFIDLAAAFGFSASFQRIRGTFDKQNIFNPADSGALRELERIIRHEAATRKDTLVSWGDLVDFTASGNPDFANDAPCDKPSPMQTANSANSIARNRHYWSLYDWTEGGDEWSASWGGTEALWHKTILPRVGSLLPAGHILEIAPGYGRCTQFLATQCRSMTLVDLTEKCIEACKQRFRDLPSIRYVVNDGKSLEAVENESVDFVFSWDSLVHVEKDVMEAYLHQLASKLKTGGLGFLHHSNMGAFRNPFTGELSVENRHWRGESMSAELFRAYCRDAGLRCLSQEIIAWGGEVLNDCFSVITKGGAQPDRPPRIVENPHFMQEATGRGNPPDFYRALGIRKGSSAAAAPEESYRKARGFIEESKFTEAARALEDYLLARPGDALAHNDLGCLYTRLGEKDKTLEHFEKAVELEPGNATYLKNLADCYQVEQGRTDDALRLYHRILAGHPGDVETLLALGHVCIALARLDDARTFFEKALAFDPDNEAARTILRQLRSRPDRAPAEDAGEGKTSVSIIIPAGDDPKILSRCIGTVIQNTEGADYEILLTSGLAPAGGEESYVPVQERKIRLAALPASGTPAAALNAAVRKASGRYLVFMDSRIVLSRGWLEPLQKTAVSNPMAGTVSPRVGMPPDTLIEAGFTVVAGDTAKGNGEGEKVDTPRYNFACETPSGSRYMTLMPRAAWEQCGGFDEELTDFGMALMDLSLSIRAAGKSLIYQPLSAVGLADSPSGDESGNNAPPEDPGRVIRKRPSLVGQTGTGEGGRGEKSVLVLGVYLADRLNTAEDIAAVLSASKTCRVTQRWVALGTAPPVPALASVTALTIREKTPKFRIVNDLLAGEDLSRYDYVLLTDDDVVMPEGFLDAFIGLQEKLGFAVAQPARTSNSYIDHPIVEQAKGLLARETRFVEIGPVVSFHRSAYDLVFPFDLTSPMGWGYENVWSLRLGERGLKMGILDATPVDHSIRKPVENYDWSTADRQRTDFLDRNAHLPIDSCFTTVQAIRLEGEPG